MNEYPRGIKFKYSWRKYQQRVLDDLQDHLHDQHLHVIAPPGSGKTVLGLEVALRLNKPTLILAPTIAIRNQWVQRFCELFLQTKFIPDWISNDIRKPKFLTVVTYQGLHAACNNLKILEDDLLVDEDFVAHDLANLSKNSKLNSIIKGLKTVGLKTLVVDEAHHLKNEWWQTLTNIKEKINPVVVGLTATPPYDVSATEWHRYIQLNGPIDTEISVPELIIEGDLCPHQDFINYTIPTESENQNILEFRANIEDLFSEIKHDNTILKAFEAHFAWLDPNENLDWIYSNIKQYYSILVFLNANNKLIPKIHFDVIGYKKFEIPNLDYFWIENILDFYLYKAKEDFKEYEEHQNKLENKLRRFGAIEKKQINFSNNKKITGFLTSSLSKLNGIKDIVDFEYQQLNKELRMVILTDYIRKEFIVSTSQNNLNLNKIGVIPIFEKLRRENRNNKKIGVLSGSIVIIPKSAFVSFQNKTIELGIVQNNSTPISYDDDYLLINQSNLIKNHIITVVTDIFESGEIEILIGTKSLLGEGWDAPSINSLILASFVGSFVLSNQMRGRAIRTQLQNPNKTANIWHLVTIDKTTKDGGEDFELLKRRFRSFVGISLEDNPVIENGIERLKLINPIIDEIDIYKKNTEMYNYAANRNSLKQKWISALEKGVNLVEEIKIPFEKEKNFEEVKKMYFSKTIGNLIAMLSSGLIFYFEYFMQIFGRASRNIRSGQDFYMLLSLFGFVAIIIFGRLTLKTLFLVIKFRDISKDIQKIGDALLQSLIKFGLIKSDLSNLKVESSVDEFGSIYCHLDGGSTFEKSLFINALQEVLLPVDNPKYIIIRKNNLISFLNQKDYHPVPDLIGKNKKTAEYFKYQWEIFVGSCELIYTRTIKGRKILLKSRTDSLSSQFEDKIMHINKWR